MGLPLLLSPNCRRLFDALPEAIVVAGGDTGEILAANDASLRLFGYERDELVGRPIEVLIPPTLRRLHERERGGYAAKPRAREMGSGLELVGLRKDGSELPVEVALLPVDDEVPAVVACVRDISERKASEARAVAAQHAAEAAEEAGRQLLAMMGHEMRTPLTGILGYAHLLAEESLSGEQHESVESIVEAGNVLLRLVNDVLDLARAEAGFFDVSLQPVALGQVVPRVVGIVRGLAEAREVSIDAHGDADAWVRADPQRLAQVLLNLVSNAVKYNVPGGSVEVSWEPSGEGAGTEWRLLVKDTGSGLSPEQLGRLFTPFERFDAGRRGISGTGIGLSLTRHLVKAMGGTIEVESEPRQGSVFAVSLPAAQEQSAAGLVDYPR